MYIRSSFLFMFITALFCQFVNAQQWQLSNPTNGAPGFLPGYGENIYVGGENDPGLRLTRTARAVMPTVVLSDTTYPGQSKKESPLIAQANDGSALVFWYDDGNDINAQIKARKIDANGAPQGNVIILSLTPSSHEFYHAPHWTLASNGEQIVLVWEYFGDDIQYQLYNFDGIPLTIIKQANQDTIVNDPLSSQWHPGTCNPSTYMREDGSFIIAWQDERNAEIVLDIDFYFPGKDIGEIYARRFDATGEPLGDNFKVNQDSIPRVQTNPAICMNDSGTIFCYWLECDTTSFPIVDHGVVRGRIIGENFSQNLQGSGDNENWIAPDVVSSTTGFAALWQQGDSLITQSYDNQGNPQSPPLSVCHYFTTSYAISAIEHEFAIIWNKDNSPDIQGRLFDPIESRLGDVKTIISGTTTSADMSVANMGTGISYLNENSTCVNAIFINDNLELQYHTERLNTDTGGAEHKNPLGVQLTNGNYLTLWLDTRSGKTQIYGQIFNSDAEKIGGNFPLDISTEENYYNDLSLSMIAHPVDGVIIAFNNRSDHGTKKEAWLQRLSSAGNKVGSPIQMVETSNTSISNIKLSILPSYPFTVLVTWINDNNLYGKFYDSDLNALGDQQLLNIPHDNYKLAAGCDRFWLLGIDETTDNLYICNYSSNIQQLSETIQINDTSIIVNSYYKPFLNILPNGKMLAVWAQKSDWGNSIKDLYAQLLDDQGEKIGNNFRVSSYLRDQESSSSIDEFYCTSIDSIFVITWDNLADRTRDETHIVKIDQFGKLAESPTTITNNEQINNQKIFMQNRDRYLSLQQIPGNPNDSDISINIYESTVLNASGFYNSPVFLNEDTLTWKKLSWLDDVPDNTSVKVFFRCKDNLRNEDDKYIPWLQIENGQTENLPAGKRAQWRVELTGTESISPIVYDLIGDYDRKTGLAETDNSIPYTYKLDPVYPNPANSRVTIAYELAAPAKATIAIYNILGQRINQWQLAQQPAGGHTWHWNGETGLGSRAASGIYFITLEANSFRATRKVLLMQ